ncbi:hypothetical protein INT47_005464 [Mucor saturninus]|uniref:Uncharacterized protein n=1 Tax=Mucor saturninus TaxID=64648 RepID=A0A8H7RFA3_9FUNG|nr:hypothetical protein INT47_005464 [Mucor saturninus]
MLFAKNSLVRTKVGETIPLYSQEEKGYQYDDIRNLKSFKVFIRFFFVISTGYVCVAYKHYFYKFFRRLEAVLTIVNIVLTKNMFFAENVRSNASVKAIGLFFCSLTSIGEAARETADESKILHGKSKLLQKGKDLLDGLLKTLILESDVKKAVVYAL